MRASLCFALELIFPLKQQHQTRWHLFISKSKSTLLFWWFALILFSLASFCFNFGMYLSLFSFFLMERYIQPPQRYLLCANKFYTYGSVLKISVFTALNRKRIEFFFFSLFVLRFRITLLVEHESFLQQLNFSFYQKKKYFKVISTFIFFFFAHGNFCFTECLKLFHFLADRSALAVKKCQQVCIKVLRQECESWRACKRLAHLRSKGSNAIPGFAAEKKTEFTSFLPVYSFSKFYVAMTPSYVKRKICSQSKNWIMLWGIWTFLFDVTSFINLNFRACLNLLNSLLQ